MPILIGEPWVRNVKRVSSLHRGVVDTYDQMVDGRLGSRLRGYNPVAPRLIKLQALCAPPLVPPVISRGTPRQAKWETSVSEGRNYGREMAGQLGLWFRLPRKSQGSFTCRKSATWDRWLNFPSEGRHAVDFFARKIRRLRPGSNQRPEC
jgi:hypothetical protein